MSHCESPQHTHLQGRLGLEGRLGSERQQGWVQKKTVRSRERHRTPKGHARRVVWLTTAHEWKVVWIRW